MGIDDVFLGNGVSELVTMAVQGLLEDGDEVLIPAPDYPLWTAVAGLAGGRAVHYLCDEGAGWLPDLADMAAKITDRTRAVVIINPNNPTGAVYPRELLTGMLDLARRHQLLVFADEIYDRILYDDAVHHCAAALAPDVFCLTPRIFARFSSRPVLRLSKIVTEAPSAKSRSLKCEPIKPAPPAMRFLLPANAHRVDSALGGFGFQGRMLDTTRCQTAAAKPSV